MTTSTINGTLEAFVEAGSDPGREGVVELFRSYLDNQAYETLDQADRSRWERAVEADEDAGSFCNLFGPERLLKGLNAFLGWFVIRRCWVRGARERRQRASASIWFAGRSTRATWTNVWPTARWSSPMMRGAICPPRKSWRRCCTRRPKPTSRNHPRTSTGRTRSP